MSPPPELAPKPPLPLRRGLKQWLTLGLKVVLTGVVGYLVYRKLEDPAKLGTVLAAANPLYLLLAVGAVAVSKYMGALRLRRLLQCIGVPLERAYAWRLTLVGMFYNLLLPGGVGGDGYKVLVLKRYFKTGVKKLVLAHLTDRLSGLSALLFGAVFFLGRLPLADYYGYHFATPMPAGLRAALPLLSMLGLVLAIAGWWALVQWVFRAFRPVFWETTLQSLLLQALQILAAYFLVLGVGAPGSTLVYLALFLLAAIGAVLPLTLGGVGMRELVFAYGASLTGIPEETAVAIGLLTFLAHTVLAVWGLVIDYQPRKLVPGTPLAAPQEPTEPEGGA